MASTSLDVKVKEESTKLSLPHSYAQSDRKDDGTNTWVHRLDKRVPCLGIIFALITSVIAVTAGLLVKLTQSVHGVQISVFRACIQLIFYTVTIQTRGIKIKPASGEYLPVAGRAFLCGIGLTASYIALGLIPLGDATVIRLSLPIWTLVVSYFVLGESCSLLKVSAVVVSLSGVVLITKPEDCLQILDMIYTSLFMNEEGASIEPQANSTLLSNRLANETNFESFMSNDRLIGCSLTLLSSVSLAISFVCLRLTKSTPVETVVFWVSISQILCGSCLMSHWCLPDNWLDCLYIVLSGLCGILGQWFCSYSLKLEEPGVISLVRTVDIEIAFIYSALLHETITNTSIVGAVLVSYGTVAVVMPKLIESRRMLKSKQ